MEIPLTTPALLFPAIAILMLGYVNRYIGTAGVIRAFKKDYDAGYKHVDVVKQVRILRKRIELSRIMLAVGIFALICACLSMLFILLELPGVGKISFGFSIFAMIFSLLISSYETFLSNKSLFIEIDDIFKQEGDR